MSYSEKASMIRSGHAWTEDDPELFSGLFDDEQRIVRHWIAAKIKPSIRVNKYESSYTLKHRLEQATGIYMTNNQFKDAMLLCGYRPVDSRRMNWIYRIKNCEEIECSLSL